MQSHLEINQQVSLGPEMCVKLDQKSDLLSPDRMVVAAVGAKYGPTFAQLWLTCESRSSICFSV